MKAFDVGYVNFGDTKGEYIGVERLDNGQLLINEVTARSGLGKLNVFETSDEGDRTRHLEVKDYDHRLEAWYAEPIKLGKSMWSSIYQWEDKPDIMSISSSYLVRGKDNEIIGVIGVDLILSQIGTFLEKLEIGQSGKAFILERDGFLVANSGSSKPTQVINGQASRVKGWESADGLIRATSQQLIKQYSDLRQISDGRQFSFDIGNQRQLVKATPWRDPLGLDWLTVVVVPEGDFMTQINANKHTTILLCLFTFAAATAIGVLTARWISGQIGELNSAARGIASGDLNQRVETSGIVGIVEIGILAASFNEMTRQLKESIKNLKETTAAKERIESGPTGRDAPSAFRGPVLPDETADTRELRDIRGYKRCPDSKRLSSDQEVIRADWRSCRFQRGAQITGVHGVLLIEGNDADGTREEDTQPFGVFTTPFAPRNPKPKLEQHHRRDPDGSALGRRAPQLLANGDGLVF